MKDETSSSIFNQVRLPSFDNQGKKPKYQEASPGWLPDIWADDKCFLIRIPGCKAHLVTTAVRLVVGSEGCFSPHMMSQIVLKTNLLIQPDETAQV